MQCEDCHYTDPSGYQDVTQGCPNCGSPNFYTDQPSPIHSEMEMRDMPAPGEEDQGGNPLKEGILADNGWQPGGTSQGTGRDESFASVHGSIEDNIVERQAMRNYSLWHEAADFHIEQVVEPGPHTVEVDAPGQPLILQHENPELLDAAKAQLDPHSAGLIKTLFQVGGGAAGGLLGTALGPEGTVAGAMLGRAAGGLVGGIVGGGVENALGENQVSQAPQPAGTTEPYQSLQQVSQIVNAAFGDDFSHPSSQDHIPANDTDDPEQVDPHEKNDGDNDTWQKDFSVNGIGGGQSPFGEDSGAMEALQLLLPLVLHHHENGTGADDPLMHALDQMLEAEAPGYKDSDPDHEAVTYVLSLGKPGGEGHDPIADAGGKDEAGDTGGDDDLDDNDIDKESRVAAPPTGLLMEPMPEEAALQSENWGEEPVMDCPNCGAHTQMYLGGCPHCGHTVEQFPPARVAAAWTHEQIKAVSDVLKSQGREDEIPALIDNPDNYIDILNQIQQQEPVVDPGTPPDQAMQPPMPTQEETPPDAGMPMPAPPTGIQPMGQLRAIVGADNMATTCPKCDSHTTGMLDMDERKAHCHSCGNVFTVGTMEDKGVSTASVHASWHVFADKADGDGDDHNVTTLPAADRASRPDDADAQTGLSWTDADGNPLKKGQQYEMYSTRYEIPDLVTITQVRPESISYVITGEYGIDHETELTKEDADMYGVSFQVDNDGTDPNEPNAVNDPGIGENNDYAGQADPNQQTDLADSHNFGLQASFEQGIVRRPTQAAQTTEAPPHADPALDWLREAGAKFTLSEQRDFIDERGVARNADKLDLTHTHYQSGYRDADEDDFLFGL